MADRPLPNVAELLASILAPVPREQQPLLVAIAERLAAERYRAWSKQVGDPHREAELLACAGREEEIASRVEALHAGAAAAQREILAKNPDLPEVNRAAFANRPLADQLAIQAQGERLGAATWRSLAKQEQSAERRGTLLRCAELEEESARVLEAILAGAR